MKMRKMPELDIQNDNIAAAYIGLFCQGKKCFDSIEPFRQDSFFKISGKPVNFLQPNSSPENGYSR